LGFIYTYPFWLGGRTDEPDMPAAWTRHEGDTLQGRHQIPVHEVQEDAGRPVEPRRRVQVP